MNQGCTKWNHQDLCDHPGWYHPQSAAEVVDVHAKGKRISDDDGDKIVKIFRHTDKRVYFALENYEGSSFDSAFKSLLIEGEPEAPKEEIEAAIRSIMEALQS